jgi:hypothetical protein
LWQVGGFVGTLVSSTNKIDRHDITEILLKVALNTIEARWGVNSCRLVSISPYLPPRHLWGNDAFLLFILLLVPNSLNFHLKSQALVSFKKCMPLPLPYFKVNICPFLLPHFASIFFAYLWSFRCPNYIVTLPEIFLFTTATFKYIYRAPLRRNWTRISANVACFIFKSLKRIQPLPVCAGFFICIRNSLDRPCVIMPSWSSPLKCKVSLSNTDNCSNADYKNMFNSKLLTFDS